MKIANPLRAEEADAWDRTKLGGVQLPGKSFPMGASSPRKWDEAQGNGTSGATLKWTGDGLAEFDIDVEVWEPEQFDEWWGANIQAIVAKTPKGQKPKAYDIEHPACADLDIKSVVVVDRTQWEPVDDTGLWGCKIKVKQFRAPEPGLGKPAKSEASSPTDTPQPKDAADEMIEDIMEEIEKEAAK